MAVPTREGRQDYRTPRAFYAELEARFGRFLMDAAADDANHLAPLYYTASSSALRPEAPWAANTYCNPPYGRADGGVEAWARKADHEARAHGVQVVMLLNVQVTSTHWFHELVWRPFRRDGWPVVEPVEGRIAFGTEAGAAPAGAPFACLLIVWQARGKGPVDFSRPGHGGPCPGPGKGA